MSKIKTHKVALSQRQAQRKAFYIAVGALAIALYLMFGLKVTVITFLIIFAIMMLAVVVNLSK